MSRKLKPVGHRVLVKLKKIDEVTEVVSNSGIITEIKNKSKLIREQFGTQEAYVVEVGDLAYKAFSKDYTGQPWCKKGDCVLICKYSGDDRDDLDDDGGIYRMINDEDVMGVFEGEHIYE